MSFVISLQSCNQNRRTVFHRPRRPCNVNLAIMSFNRFVTIMTDERLFTSVNFLSQPGQANGFSQVSHTKHLQINNLHIFTIVFHFRHILFLQDPLIHSFFPFHMSDHHSAKGFLCHRSMTWEFTTSWYPKFIFTNIPFPAQNTPLQNCFPSLGSFPSPRTVYPEFDSWYSHFMPYRMTPSVRHRAIEVHYYYYIKCEFQYTTSNDYFVWTCGDNHEIQKVTQNRASTWI